MESLMQGLHELGHSIAFFFETSCEHSIPPIRTPEGTQLFGPYQESIAATVAPVAEWRPDLLISNCLLSVELETALHQLGKVFYIAHNYRAMCISGTKTHTRPIITPCQLRFGARCLGLYFPKGCGGRNPLSAWKLFLFQKSQLKLLLKTDHIITNSSHMQEQWKLHGYPEEKISMIPPFPPQDSTAMLPIPEALPDLSDPDTPLQLIFAGRMDATKGGHYLIQAAEEVQQTLNRQVHIVMAGEGPERSNWTAQAEQIQNQNITFQFPGWLNGSDLWRAIDSSHCLIFPSVWPEPFGLIGIEAGLRQCPVAGFLNGGVKDWLKTGVNGYGVSHGASPATALAKAIIQTTRDPDHHRQLRKGGAEIARGFSREQHFKRFTQLIETTPYGHACVRALRAPCT